MPLPLDINQLQPLLADQFGLVVIENAYEVEGGNRCKNIAFDCLGTRYFLKQYREGLYNTIDQVKQAERYFADRGIPVILPILNRLGASAFCFENMWYSLFPFVQGMLVKADRLTPHHVASLGLMHAQMHRMGEQAPLEAYSAFTFWDRSAFLQDIDEVERMVQPDDLQTRVKQLAFENLHLQATFVRSNEHDSDAFGLPNTCLLHGDFIYTNIFFDEPGNVQHVFDLERTGIGPRAYDLARSLFISCFDDGWHEKNFEFARIYLKAYQTVYPISYEEFSQGVMMYTTHFMYMSWLETAILLGDSSRFDALVGPANDRLHHFLEGRQAIIDQLFVK